MDSARAHDPKQHAQSENQPAPSEDGLTLRAFLIGLGLCVFMGVALTYNRMVVQGPFMGNYHMDRGVLFRFLYPRAGVQPPWLEP